MRFSYTRRSGQLPTRPFVISKENGIIFPMPFRVSVYGNTFIILFTKCPFNSHSYRKSLCDIHRITSSSGSAVHPHWLNERWFWMLIPSSPRRWYFSSQLANGSQYVVLQLAIHPVSRAKRFFLSYQPCRLVRSISQSWHSSFIHLVGRICGHVQRFNSVLIHFDDLGRVVHFSCFFLFIRFSFLFQSLWRSNEVDSLVGPYL